MFIGFVGVIFVATTTTMSTTGRSAYVLCEFYFSWFKSLSKEPFQIFCLHSSSPHGIVEWSCAISRVAFELQSKARPSKQHEPHTVVWRM